MNNTHFLIGFFSGFLLGFMLFAAIQIHHLKLEATAIEEMIKELQSGIEKKVRVR